MRSLLYPAPVRQKTPNPIRLSEISDPSAVADTGHVYTNDTATGTELMYLDDAGAEVQITANGALNGAAVGLSSGTAGDVVYLSATKALTSEAAFAYNASTNTLTVGGVSITGGTATAAQVADGIINNGGNVGLVRGSNVVAQITTTLLQTSLSLDLSLNGTAIFAKKGDNSLQLGATSTGSATNQTIGSHNTTGADKAGANLTIEAGNGTGTGGSGSIIFRTAPVAASSSTANTLATRWTIATAGGLTAGSNLRFAHGTSALATDATEGFFHMNSCAGAPTGVPASIPTGQIPMVFDTTNARLYFYHGAAWHYVAQTA